MRKKKKISIIINPVSGNGFSEKQDHLLKSYLDNNNYESNIFLTTKDKDSTEEFILQQLNRGCRKFMVVGGDGTVNTVGKYLAQTGAAMGVLPNGSGNGLARHLQIPVRLADSISLIDEHRVIDIDYGMVNDIPFFCTAGIGFDAKIAHVFSSQTVRGFKKYLEIVLKEFTKYKSEDFVIQFDGKELKTSSFLITFANAGQFGNNAFISPDAKIDDGLLDLCIISPFPHIFAPLVGAQVISKTINISNYYEMIRVKEAVIKRTKPGWVHYDGEPVRMPEELSFKSIPSGLKVLQPTERMIRKSRIVNLLN